MTDGPKQQESLTEAEIAGRRDDVIRRMANTKPKPKPKPTQRVTRRVTRDS